MEETEKFDQQAKTKWIGTAEASMEWADSEAYPGPNTTLQSIRLGKSQSIGFLLRTQKILFDLLN